MIIFTACTRKGFFLNSLHACGKISPSLLSPKNSQRTESELNPNKKSRFDELIELFEWFANLFESSEFARCPYNMSTKSCKNIIATLDSSRLYGWVHLIFFVSKACHWLVIPPIDDRTHTVNILLIGFKGVYMQWDLIDLPIPYKKSHSPLWHRIF